MSTTETILFRAMNDTAFADAILADPDKALSEYELSAEELENFQGLSRADFEMFASASPEERKTFCLGCTWGPPVLNHNQTALKVHKGLRWNHNETRLKSHGGGKFKSMIKVIVERMISEPGFADTVLADAEKALAEYDLSADEVAKFKGLSHAQFEATPPEERKSMSLGSMETMKKAWKDG